MSISIPTLIRACGVIAGVCTGQQAAGANLIVNSGFATDLEGWEAEGTVSGGGGAAAFSDAAGSRAVLFQTAGVPLALTLSLTLSFDCFTALSPEIPLGGTPDSVFISAFLGATTFGPDFSSGVFDSAIGVVDLDFRGPANLAAGLVSGPSLKGPGWTHYSMAVPLAGFVTVGFEFIEGNGIAGDSVAAVDNVVLEAAQIPEPSVAACLLASGILGQAWRRRPGASGRGRGTSHGR